MPPITVPDAPREARAAGRRWPREAWRAAVLRTRLIPDAPRVVLLVLGDEANHRGVVTVDRDRLAGQLGLFRSRVDERLTALRRAGLIQCVQRASRRGPPMYALVIPTDRAPVGPVRVGGERAPVEPAHVDPPLPVRVHSGHAPVKPVRVGTPGSGDTGRRAPVEAVQAL